MAAPVDPVPATSDEVTLVGESAPTFEAFYEETHARLYTALCLVTGSRHEAEEVMQETFVRVWERWDRIGRLEEPTGYLYRAAMNLVRSRYRRASLALRRTVGLAPRTDDLAAVEDRVVVARALRALTPSQRAAVDDPGVPGRRARAPRRARTPRRPRLPGAGRGALRKTNFRRRFWAPAAAAAGLDPAPTYHDLRHTSAALAIAEGAHPKAIQARMGHASITTTLNVYEHMFPSLDVELADRLESARADALAARLRHAAVVDIDSAKR